MGDRIPYVMVRGAVGAKAWEKAEDPVFVLEQSLQLDTEWCARHPAAPQAPCIGVEAAVS